MFTLKVEMVSNIDEDEKEKKVTPIYNVYNGQYENQECLFLTVDEDEKLKRTLYVLGQRRNWLYKYKRW